ncbi:MULTISPECIES: LPS-assembly lipoprotein LptE [unclassified Janthinobacterium]|uniref:LPS-assembly lipoprotein LptE n=1 Tax=unclassified Janthinobacterium TaxID=2610881 RepID=UPI000345101C|nr:MULTISPECIES: LPS assembly lipoprotein LptE [unclassified Janthinobacterium]MEC5162410.1 LPS-assembly lipoprotein [Janthinobacterium sp. CG_S6]
MTIQRARVAGLMLLAALALSACGFHLRGANGSFNLPFATLFITLPKLSPLAIDLKRNIRVNGGTEILEARDGADGIIDVLSDPDTTRGKTILSLSNNGRVREYQLSYTIVFRVLDRQGTELLGPTTISLTRPISFNESQLLAKETEEALLYRDMKSDMVQQMMRRIAAVKLALPAMSVPPAASAAAAPAAAVKP